MWNLKPQLFQHPEDSFTVISLKHRPHRAKKKKKKNYLVLTYKLLRILNLVQDCPQSCNGYSIHPLRRQK